MKNKKIILLFISFLTTLGLVSCGAIDSEVETEYPVETFFEENVVSHGMQIRNLSSGKDANDHEYKTFGFTVLPSNSYYREVSAAITFADNRNNGSQYLTATVDNSNCTVTVTMLQLFDSVATLRLTTAKASVYADVTIRLNPRYSFTCSLDAISSTYHETGLVGDSTKNYMDFKSQFLANSFISMSDNTEVSVNPYQGNLPSFSGTPSISLSDFVLDETQPGASIYVLYPFLNYVSLRDYNDGMGSFEYSCVPWACFSLLNYFNDSFGSNFNSTSDFFDEDYLSSTLDNYYLNYYHTSHESVETNCPRNLSVSWRNSLEQYARDHNGYLYFDIDINALPFTFAFNGVSFAEVNYAQQGLMPVSVDIWNPSLTISSSESSITF